MSRYSTKWLQVSEPSPHVLHVQISREPVNALSKAFSEDYSQLFENLIKDGPDVRAVVLSSSSPRIFTAGLDLSDAGSWNDLHTEPARTALGIRKMVSRFQNAIGAPERCPFPVIAAVHGPVIGLGVDIISYCDIRFAASDATFCIKEVDVGLAADLGTLAFLPKITGNQSLARELAYTARPFSAVEAEKLGLVSKVVEGSRDAVVGAALELAKVIAAKSPIAVLGTKQLIIHARDHTVAENLDYTSTWNAAALQTKDVEECVSGFKKKQPPYFPPIQKRPAKL